MITSKQVTRFYAPYQSSSGTWRQKGFTTRMAAARFLAKQMLFDKVFGPKVEHYQSDDSDNGWSYWMRDTPDDKAERAEMFAKAYPLETCMSGECDRWGGPACDEYCEGRGFAVCQMKRELRDWTRKFANGQLTYGPEVAS